MGWLDRDLFTGKEVSQLKAEREARRALASQAAVGPDSSGSGYGSLRAVSAALRAYGRTLQWIAWAVGAAGGVAGLGLGTSNVSAVGAVLVVAMGVGMAVGLHALGMLIAAAGEALEALADIAVHTRPTAPRKAAAGSDPSSADAT
jgi:hypothetical protein